MTSVIAFLSGTSLLWAGLLFGVIFGVLLHRGGVTDFNIIVKQFLFRDFTVLKVMFTAIVVGGVGVFILHGQELANFHIKPAAMLAVLAGAVLFGVGMVVYGYCPGTGVAAMATGKLDAAVLTGFIGVGGGFLLMPALVKFARLPLRMATGTSLAVIAFNSASGFASHYGEADPRWTLALTFAGLAVAGVVAGTFLATRLPVARLRQGFAILVLATGAFVLWRSFSGLP